MKNPSHIRTRRKAMWDTKALTKMALLAAVGFLLQRLDVPLPFLPPWLKMDVAEIPVLLGGFTMGPMAAVIIELVKNALSLPLTKTGGVGEVANFLLGLALVFPASMIYRKKPTRKQAIIGLAIGTLALTVIGVILNYAVLMPFYINVMFGGSAQKLIDFAAAANPNLNSLWMICLFGIAPFNIIKGIFLSVVTLLMYKPLAPFLKLNAVRNQNTRK